ncbi:MAG: 50S ribosomal protein L10 [Bacteroidota bacterium]|nr:50S ribosomal protein L10 [Bacteroidota bacterium]
MKREDKNILIEQISEEINKYDHFYLADIAGLNASDSTELRGKCYEQGIKLMVVKNTLMKLALDKADGEFEELYSVLKDNTAVMFADTANAPGKVIKGFLDKHEKPMLKAAFAADSIFVGEENLDMLASMKSHDELIGDIVILLQSPMKTVISQLQSGGQTISGVLKALEEKE